MPQYGWSDVKPRMGAQQGKWRQLFGGLTAVSFGASVLYSVPWMRWSDWQKKSAAVVFQLTDGEER
ncbi:MAG: hypothetical protein ACKPHU_00660 [Planctomycetaceae bacterium]